MFLKRFLKLAHTLSAIGLMGAVAADLVLLSVVAIDAPVEYHVVREGIAAISRYILLPSLLIVLVSGLLSMAVHPPFHDRGWVWVKALLGIGLFEGTLGAVESKARRGMTLAEQALAGEVQTGPIAALLASEWIGLWTVLALSFASVVLGIWRPRLRRLLSQGP